MTLDDIAEIWAAPDGWPLRCVRLNPRLAHMRRGAMLFLNGRGDHMEKYAEALRDFAAMGWQVESFDWRGQGGSGRLCAADPMLGHVDDFGIWIDDLSAYVHDWQSRTQGPHVIVAHSMGGHLALRGLAEQRVEVDAAVLLAPMLGISAARMPERLAEFITRTMCAMGMACKPVWPHTRISEDKLSIVQKTLTHSEERFEQELYIRQHRPDLVMSAPSWGWLRAAYRSMGQLQDRKILAKVTTPLLVLAAEHDRLVSEKAIRNAARWLPNARTHFYGANVAHEILREVDSVRDDTLARIQTFFDAEAISSPSSVQHDITA